MTGTTLDKFTWGAADARAFAKTVRVRPDIKYGPAVDEFSKWLMHVGPSLNVFCPTGPGGGVDPTCGEGGAAAQAAKEGRRADLKAVMSVLPPAAMSRLSVNVKSVVIVNSEAEMREAVFQTLKKSIVAEHGGMPDGLTDADLREAFGRHQNTGNVAGGYMYDTKTMLLHEGSTGFDVNRRGVYAHEVGHGIDGDQEFSSTAAWKKLWKSELLHPSKPLSEYAATDPQEGFAEFARALYGGGHSIQSVERVYPAASQFFKERKLWPRS